jgi:hypothetical protein
MAKLSGIRKAVLSLMNENVSRNRSAGDVLTRAQYAPDLVQHYFARAAGHLKTLQDLLPGLYADFQPIETEPATAMGPSASGNRTPNHFSRAQAERLVRDIDHIFEIRANTELEQPRRAMQRRVFISHGRSKEWRAVQAFIDKDIGLPTIELAQEPNLGRTIIEKLFDNADSCDSAVIVMTGDDVANEDESRVRENVMHEIGFSRAATGGLVSFCSTRKG